MIPILLALFVLQAPTMQQVVTLYQCVGEELQAKPDPQLIASFRRIELARMSRAADRVRAFEILTAIERQLEPLGSRAKRCRCERCSWPATQVRIQAGGNGIDGRGEVVSTTKPKRGARGPRDWVRIWA